MSNYVGHVQTRRPLCQQRPFLLGKLNTLTACKILMELLIQWRVKLQQVVEQIPTLLLLAMETVTPGTAVRHLVHGEFSGTLITGLNGGRGPHSEPVKKEECLNHVSKRLGTRLRKLKDLRVAKEAASSGRIRLQLTMMLMDKHIDGMARIMGPIFVPWDLRLQLRAHGVQYWKHITMLGAPMRILCIIIVLQERSRGV